MIEQSFVPVTRDPLEADPSYVVGQDNEGHWLAVEQHGFGGGLFISKEAAIRYVTLETCRASGTYRLVSEPLGLSFGEAPRAGMALKAA